MPRRHVTRGEPSNQAPHGAIFVHARAGGNLTKGNDMADGATEFEPITSQEQLDGILKGRLARETDPTSSEARSCASWENRDGSPCAVIE